MIVFEKIRWKNLLSTGQQFTEIDLHDTPTTLIVGNNGAGKSTLLDALCFGLFAKPFRKISKTQLINTVNEKECIVEIEFNIGSVKYKVVRGMKPSRFDIYQNDKKYESNASVADDQKYLEQSILKLNFKSFTQVVILGSSTFVPFMQLTGPNRREVIEDILDIQIFSQMNVLLKERVKEIKEEQRSCEYEMDIAQQKVEMQIRNIENLEKVDTSLMEKKQKKFDQNEQRCIEIKSRLKELDKECNKLEPQIAELDKAVDKHEKFKVMRTKIKSRFENSKKELDFFLDNHTCPTCTQDISEEFKKTKINVLDSKLTELAEGSDKITDEIKTLAAHVKNLREKSEEINGYRYEIQALTHEEVNLLKENTAILTEVGSDTTNLENERQELVLIKQQLEEKKDDCAKVNTQANYLGIVGELLKDSGIKTKIIAKFIPLINARINKYLHSMDFFVNFTLDDNFNEKILSRFRDDFTYASFSEGEKQKIDLALLFTWREVAQLKNSVATNLLILDEVFDSSLDQSATDELMKILKNKLDKTNLFVISHKGEVLIDRFDKTIEFKKDGDFSNLQLTNS
jgi:DNA repair exonuclease SbcCD ATPase subunit